MKETKKPTAAPAAAVESSTLDVAAQLQALAEQEREAERAAAERKRALDLQRQQIRKTCFDQTVTAMKAQMSQLTGIGFDLVQIAKALGLASAVSRKERKGTGPTTNEGWFRLFRTRAIQTYLKSHPDLAELLEAEKVPASDFAQHIPPPDLAAIDADAQAKAHSKCPPTAAPVS